jgi:hypothetical protein
MVVSTVISTKSRRRKNTSFTARKLLISEPIEAMTVSPV